MKKGFFIQSNKKQILGAYLAKYAFEKLYKGSDKIETTIMLVEDIPEFRNFVGKKYKRGEREITYNPSDLQSFTLTRFMPPELMNFDGRAVVIDPDIFAISDVSYLFEMNLGNNSIAACRKKDAWDSSVMVLDCQKLKHWKVSDWLQKLENLKMDYDRIMTLKDERDVLEIPRTWNSLDYADLETKFLHTTNRLTQPWRTGLPIDFTRQKMPKLFGIIPREPIHKILGKYPTHYQKHKDENIEKIFLFLLKNAMRDGVINRYVIEQEVSAGHVRKDIFDIL